MSIGEFKLSIESDAGPPAELPPALQALWWERKGDWAKAHDLSQSADSGDGDWVHAYLHRAEGDESNARYWYRRSGKAFFAGGLEEEWERIATGLLAER